MWAIFSSLDKRETGDPMEIAHSLKNPITRQLVARTPRIWTGSTLE
ncbi:hypothetical protein H8B02_18855 [Bradyrhizobium sp. Pear77]|nr:hypothetical protein [Bradyrhizobium altum]MCC8955415.1 hypothetical protein [Bradyrhizobium altum]